MKAVVALLAVAVLLIFLGLGSVRNESDARAEKLALAVEVLQKRVAALEGQRRPRTAPVSAPSAPVSAPSVSSNLANWRKLQKGMNQNEVEQLLGSPIKVDNFGSFTVWNIGGRGGEVQFDDSGRVTGWHEP